MHAHAKMLQMLQNGLHPQITFLKGCEDMECYPVAGMKARILEATVQDYDAKVIRAKVDFGSFSEYNKTFESSNYYDKHGSPILTAREAGCYHEIDTLYLMEDEGPEYFSIDSDERIELYNEFAQSGYQGTYTMWLEDKVIAASK